MKKADLKTGMIVKVGDDLFILINEVLQGKKDWTLLNQFNEDLTKKRESGARVEGDINEVSEVVVDGFCLQHNWKSHMNRWSIWERKEETPIVTLDGIEYSESTLRSIIKKAH